MPRQLTVLLLLFASLLVYALPATAQEDQESVTHVVTHGDTLYRIALRYGTTVDALAHENDITNVQSIFAGQVLTIPGLEPPTSSDNVENPLVAPAPIKHTVQWGETVSTIAQRYGISVDQVLAANNLANANMIYQGQVLQIWTADMSAAPDDEELESVDVEAEATAEVEATEEVVAAEETEEPDTATPTPDAPPSTTHVVRRGEYLAQIARRYNVSWTRIAEVNNIFNPNNITEGMSLIIPSANSVTEDFGIIDPEEHLANYTENHPGAITGTGKEFVVILSTQMAYAYEDGELVYASLVSTGLPATPTVQGDFKIYSKYESQTMAGPGYYLPGVQWIMYFYAGYAFHGTYWHENFGQPMSHGCVNMTNEEALMFYEFGEIGTPVHVRYSV